MKKLTLKLVTVITAVALAMGTLVGCGLFEVNTDRDMAQKVATVCIDKNEVDTDVIYKRDMVAGYYSYGYYYVSNYGYTKAKTYEMILDNLISNSIVVQNAKKYLATDGDYSNADLTLLKNEGVLALLAKDSEISAFNAKTKLKVGSAEYYEALNSYVFDLYNGKPVTAKDAPFRFVSATSALNAVYTAVAAVNSLVDSFMDDTTDDTHSHDSISYDVRSTPTIKQDDTDERIKVKTIFLDSTDKKAEKIKAYKKGIARLEELGLVESGTTISTANKYVILSIPYFRDTIESSINSKIVENYQDKIEEAEVAKINGALDDLYTQYDNLRKNQEAQLNGSTITDLETKLGSVSEDNFVIYNNCVGYAYVSHILIGYTDEQKEIANDNKKVVEYYNKANNTDLAVTAENVQKAVDYFVEKNIVAKDLRETWVKSGYGIYNADGSYSFKNKYVYDTENDEYTVNGNTVKLSDYIGSVGVPYYHAEDEDDDGNKVISLRFNNVVPTEFNYDGFRELAKQVLGVSDALSINGTGKVTSFNNDVYERVEDLKYAFSTDTGNLGKYLGYLYSPYTSESQYVKAFSKACKDIVAEGKGAYKMFASQEYGLHIVLCTELANEYGQYDSAAAFIAALADETSFAARFKKANEDLAKSQAVNSLATKLTNEAKNNGTKVKRYKDAYKDLVK